MSLLSEEVIGVFKEIFPFVKIKTEEHIVYEGQKLFLDIFVPAFNLVIEVNGAQHDKFVEFMHKTAFGFRSYKRRDALKREWAELNGFIFLSISESDFPLTREKLLSMLNAKQEK